MNFSILASEQTILPSEVTEEENTNKNVFSTNGANVWFGNSSAFDALMNGSKFQNSHATPPNVGVILPTDDLPTVFSKEVWKFQISSSCFYMTKPLFFKGPGKIY